MSSSIGASSLLGLGSAAACKSNTNPFPSCSTSGGNNKNMNKLGLTGPLSAGEKVLPYQIAYSKTDHELQNQLVHHKQQQQQQQDENILKFSRREAVGLTFTLSLGLGLLQPLACAEAEEEPCTFTVAPSGLAFCDRRVGSGPQPSKGQLIKAHYVGRLENGKVFDSSYDRGRPLTFRVGAGEVIKGWDEGILGGDGVPPMLAGGKRTLKLPPELAYGKRGAGCKGGSCLIPPDSVLLFDVEFLGKI